MTTAGTSTTPLSDIAAVESVLDRTERMLCPTSMGSFSAAEPPISAALRAVAGWYGIKLPGAVKPSEHEPFEEAIVRLARAAGLIAREVALEPGWQKSASVPLIAIREADGATLALLPGATRWRHVDGTRPRRPTPLDAKAADGLARRAWVLTPGLPDKPLKSRDLLLFGLQSNRRDIAAFALTSLLAGGITSLLPVATDAVTAIVIPSRDIGLLHHIVAMLVVLFVATLATRLAAAIAVLRIDGRAGAMLRVAALDRTIRLACKDAEKMPTPPAAVLITRCVQTWHRGIWHIIFTLASAFLIATPSLLVMASISPLAAAAALAVMIGAVATSAWIAKRQLDMLFSGPCSPTSWISISYEALANIEAVRGFGAEPRFFTLFAESFLSLKERFLAAGRTGALLPAIQAALEPMVMAVGIGTVLVMHTTGHEANTITFTVALMTTTAAAAALVHAFSEACMLGLQRKMISVLLDTAPPTETAVSQPPVLTGRIEFIDVSVSRGPGTRPLVDRIDLDIQPGEHIGIAGASGSGKSTLVNAMLGLVPLASGQVRYDGIALDALDSASVRRQIGTVGQMGKLFAGTIRDNIAAGTELTEADAWGALELAALAPDVRAMPLGLATPIGDAECVLSGGQVQRLLLARALAHKPRILVLDEATSALDPPTEQAVAAAIDALDVTVVSVAHRLETLRNCDRIVVLDDGRIVECGTYDELARENGFFKKQLESEISVSSNSISSSLTALERLRREFRFS